MSRGSRIDYGDDDGDDETDRWLWKVYGDSVVQLGRWKVKESRRRRGDRLGRQAGRQC